MKHRNRPAAAAAALLLAALTAGCDDASSPREARERLAARGEGDIVVAVVWPWQAQRGVRYGEGLDLAVQQINDAGGVLGRRLRLVRQDDRESVNEGLLIAQRLAEDPEVVGVIGHLQSYVSVPAAAIYDLGGMVMLSPASTDPELTAKGYGRVFRATFTDLATGGEMADFAAARGFRRVAIYYVRNPYGRTLANAFEEQAVEGGVQVVARASYDAEQDPDGRGFDPVLREWARSELDAVFIAGQVPLAGRLVAAIRRHGITVPILGGDAMAAPSLISEGGAAAEGTVVAAPFHPDDPRPPVRDFVAAFRARYGADPDAGSALGYDAVRLLAEAVTRAGSATPDAVARGLREVRWEGVTGRFAFDARGDLVEPRILKLVVRNGRFEYLDDAPPPGRRAGVR